MQKTKISYNCINCNYASLKWVGCCPGCSQWNSFEEKLVSQNDKKIGIRNSFIPALKKLDEIENKEEKRILTGITEWDRVTGGGLVPGAFLILSGDPGIGKSTLLIQVADKISKNHKIIYFCSEESLPQVKSRVIRIIGSQSNILFSDNGNFETIFEIIETEKPDVVIIDSIQNCYFENSDSLPGSTSQIKESGFALMKIAKEKNITTIVTGHITKEGTIAGPKTLEHMVDAVFYLQAEDQWNTRILRAVKNRFGPLSELGFFTMSENGLQELTDINQKILEEVTNSPGSVLVSSIEGSRPIILELQALTIASKFGVPQRVITGVDHKRVIIVAAILEKYLQVKLSSHDIFFKVTGGSKIQDSSSDLGIALALLSSYFQIPLKEKSLAIAEISLTGQIKPINNINLHINEATRFAIDNIFIAYKQNIAKKSSSLNRFNNIYDLLKLFIEKEN